MYTALFNVSNIENSLAVIIKRLVFRYGQTVAIHWRTYSTVKQNKTNLSSHEQKCILLSQRQQADKATYNGIPTI